MAASSIGAGTQQGVPCCAVPCHAVLYSAEPAWPSELPALARGEALIPGWARGNCLSAGCSPGTAGMQLAGAAPLSPLNPSPLLHKGEVEPPTCQAEGQQANNGGCRLKAGALANTQTPPAPLVLQRSSTKCRSRSRRTAKATRCRLPVRALTAQPQRRRRSARAAWPSELAGYPRKPPGTLAAPGHASGVELGLPPHRLVWPPAQGWCHPACGATPILVQWGPAAQTVAKFCHKW